jgi:4-hydroxy-tetrahydrodipicolinate synthase
MFSDASPGPAKYALSRVHDWFSSEVRLPIIPASDASRKAVDAALFAAGVLQV